MSTIYFVVKYIALFSNSVALLMTEKMIFSHELVNVHYQVALAQKLISL